MFTLLLSVALLRWLVLVIPGTPVLLVSMAGAPGLRQLVTATAAAEIRAR